MAPPILDDAPTDLARKVLEGLKERRDLVPNLRGELGKQIKYLKTATSIRGDGDYDSLGTELWNSAASYLRDDTGDNRVSVVVLVFAFMLLETAHRLRRSKNGDQRCRILRIGLRTARSCLELGEVVLATTTFEQIAPYVATASGPETLMQISRAENSHRSGFDTMLSALTSEYFLLRLMAEWKQGRMDLADLWYSKVDLTSPDAGLQLKAADLFLEVGTVFSKQKETQIAVVWFDRAFALLTTHDLETEEHTELLLTVAVAYVDELLSNSNAKGQRRAYEVVDYLEKLQGLGNRITIPIAKFKVLASVRPDDTDQITAALSRIAKLAVLTDGNFRLVMQTFHKASSISLSSTLAALKTFIILRLLTEFEDTRIWLEKATVAYVLFITSKHQGSSDAATSDLRGLFNEIASKSDIPFSAKATHAMQTLIWKAGWDSLLQHQLFDNAGPINKARIGRRLMQNALAKGQPGVAREAFFRMPPAAQNEPATRYLAFKTAVGLDDEDLASSSLAVVSKHAANDPTHLYACVLAAGQATEQRVALSAFEALLDRRPNGLHLPALLRVTARMLIKGVDVANRNANDVAEETLRVFETAAKNIDEMLQLPDDKWRAEVQWWSKNAYNLAIRLCAHVHSEYVLRMLDVCTQFMDRYPNDAGLMHKDGLEKRKMMCSFLSATALIVCGRTGEDDSDYTAQCFLHAEQHIQTFKSLYGKLNNSAKDAQSQERAFTILKFEIECVLRLRQWDKIGVTLQACMNAVNASQVSRWDTLADLLILVHEELDETVKGSHADMMTQLLQRSINDTWKREKDIAKVSRWVRFTFSLCLNARDGNTAGFSLKLLQQAGSMAENGSKGKHQPYPEHELQWLATMGFNHAVDLLVEGSDNALDWVNSALQLAKWSDDNGSLHGLLTKQKEMVMERMKTAQDE